MHIKEIIIDGFKSYAQRTVVTDFDPLFNAITGLNGSGKSNILDSICFVLGISNLSQVRAGSLQELIYKQGQAGVTKATVSIVFNNDNKAQSPIGYEQYDEITVTRQIAIGGKNKYMINGHKVQQSHVANLFQSVQLNVNNPHFLIMQGRITKVLNMKPPEILSMIEEAAGTRMFESKKAAAIKTLDKKGKKWGEITKLIDDEITPTLEKLRAERSSFFEYQKTGSEIDRLTRFLTAYDFMTAEERLDEATELLAQITASIKEKTSELRNATEEKENTQQNIELQKKRRDAEMSDALAEMEATVGELSKGVIKASVEVDNAKNAITEEEENQRRLKADIEENKACIATTEAAMIAATENIAGQGERVKAAEEKVVECEKQCNAAAIGASSDQNGMTFAEELTELQSTISASSTKIETAKMQKEHAEKDLKAKKPQAKKSETEYKRCQRGVDALVQDIEALDEKLGTMSYDATAEEKLKVRRKDLVKQRTVAKDQVDMLSARLTAFDFTYPNPQKKVNEKKVYGTVAKLLNIAAEDMEKCTALEITAGGKLFNVVVEDVKVAKDLLEKGGLKRRVTIIPLDNLNKKVLDKQIVDRAKKMVGPANVGLALEYIVHDEHFHPAMEFVFGSTLVCKTAEHAKQVTFNSKTKCKSVTLDGDVFDPRGTLTGGAPSRSSGILKMLQELVEHQRVLSSVEEELSSVMAQLDELERMARHYQGCLDSKERKQQELDVLRVTLQNNTHYKVVSEVKELEEQILQLKEEISQCQSAVAAAEKKIKQVEKEQASYEQKRDALMSQAEGAKKAAVKEAKAAKSTLQQMQQVLDEQKLEIESYETEIVSIEKKVAASEASIVALKKEHAKAEAGLAQIKEAYVREDGELGKKKAKLMKIDNKIAELEAHLSSLSGTCSEITVELKNLHHGKEKSLKDKKSALGKVDALLSHHPWISGEKSLFGKEGSPYEFIEGNQSNDPTLCKRRLEQLKIQQDKLSKSVNMKVLSMFEDAEKKYNDLLKKRDIVEADKSKIESAIEELDRKKNDALLKAHEKVNRDFGAIFSTLLPGTIAKLDQVLDGSVLTGLEIRVGFGQIWKESLTELSGGQRSLVALSLILSLLKFKPAPLYILDEVDAALDLSHTQNIGQMIRQFFKQSQFVVVSLKDGMFNNANVLFKTKFVDGVSTVRRFAQAPTTSSGTENRSSSATTQRGRGGKAASKRAKSALSSRQAH